MASRNRIRKYDKSHAEIILRVRQFFEREREGGKRIHVQKVVERTCAATGVSHNLVTRIRSQEDIDSWSMAPGESVSVIQPNRVPDSYAVLVRQTVRNIFLEKEKVPTLDSIFQRLTSLTSVKMEHLHLCTGEDFSPLNRTVWTWSRSTLHRYLKSIGFIHGEKPSHYEIAKTREYVV